MDSLRDGKEALVYINAALNEEMPGVFLLAMRDIVEARVGGLGQLSKKSGLNRESLYRTLSKKGNPELSTVQRILEAIGFRLVVELKKGRSK